MCPCSEKDGTELAGLATCKVTISAATMETFLFFLRIFQQKSVFSDKIADV